MPWTAAAASSMFARSPDQFGGVGGEERQRAALTAVVRPRWTGSSDCVVDAVEQAAPICAPPAASAASAAEISRPLRCAPGGVSSAARASTLARDAIPPRRPARSATRSSRSATAAIGADRGLGGVPGLEVRPGPESSAAARQGVVDASPVRARGRVVDGGPHQRDAGT